MPEKPDEKKPQSKPTPVEPGKSAAVVDAQVTTSATTAKPTAPATEKKPVEHGPHDNYGIETPSSSDPDAWTKYDEDIFKAKEAYEKTQRGENADVETAAAAKAPQNAKADEQAQAEKDAAAAATAKAEAEKTGLEKGPPEKPGEVKGSLPDADEFELEAGNKWTRKQIREEILGLRTLGAEASEFRKLFGTDAKTAAQNWSPLLKELSDHPDLVSTLELARKEYFEFAGDPEYAKFMEENRERFRAWRNENPSEKKPASAPAQTELEKTVKQLQDNLAAIQNERIVTTLRQQQAAEKAKLQSDYPVLQDAALWDVIVNKTINVCNQQRAANPNAPSTYRLTDAVRDCWPIIQRWSTMTPEQKEKTEEKIPVALRSGASGADTSVGEREVKEEEVYPDARAAAAAWIRENPEFKG